TGYQASGNVIFDAPAAAPDPRRLERSIEVALEAHLGFRVDTFLRPMSVLRGICGLDPFPGAADPAARVHVIFLREPPPASVEGALSMLEGPDDRFRVVAGDVFWWRRGGLANAPFPASRLGRIIGEENTMRTLDTVRRI